MSKTCFFVGHRNTPASVYPELAKAVERHISECGVTDFLVGRYGDFDRMAKRAVMDAKERHPEIKLYLMLAYLPKPGQDIHADGFDGTIFPEGMETVPRKLAILRLNQFVLKESDYLIAYIDHEYGGAYQTLEYAQRQERKGELHITNLAETRKIAKSVSS